MPYWLGMSHWVIAVNLTVLGAFAEALGELDRCHAVADAIGDARLAAYAGWNRAYVLARLGDTDAAVAEARRAVERARDPYTVHVCRCFLGWAHLQAGDIDDAVAELGAGSTWLVDAGFERAGGWMTAFWADALLEAGGDDAVAVAERSLARMRRTGFEFGIAEARRVLARAAHRRGESDALLMMAEVAAAFASVEAAFEEGCTYAELAEMTLAAGDPAAAQAQLRTAITRFEACGAHHHAERARARSASRPSAAPAG